MESKATIKVGEMMREAGHVCPTCDTFHKDKRFPAPPVAGDAAAEDELVVAAEEFVRTGGLGEGARWSTKYLVQALLARLRSTPEADEPCRAPDLFLAIMLAIEADVAKGRARWKIADELKSVIRRTKKLEKSLAATPPETGDAE